jgi:hypothetical protein
VEDDPTRIDLAKLDDESLGSLRFILGGFGDARHLFTSLIDLNRQFDSLSAEKQDKLQVKFLMNDIKAQPFAKLLINLAAMRKLSEHDLDKIGTCAAATRAAALCVILFMGNIMPAYMCTEIKEIMNDFVENGLEGDEFWSFLNIDEASWSRVKAVFKQWLSPPPKVSTNFMMELFNKEKDAKTKSLIDQTPALNDCANEIRQEYLEYFDNMSDEDLRKLIKEDSMAQTPEEVRNELKENLAQMSQHDVLHMREPTSVENKYAKKYKFMYLPRIALDENDSSLLEVDYDKNYLKQNLDEFVSHVKRNWKPNMTMIDNELYEMVKWNPLNTNIFGIDWTLDNVINQYVYYLITL